jgi:molecular chaperone HscA
VKPSYGLSDAEVARMLQESFAHAADDATARVLAEARVEADQLVEVTRTALEADAALLSANERASIESALDALIDERGRDDAAAIRAAIEALNRATGEFAARRMDVSIRALAGRSVDSLV